MSGERTVHARNKAGMEVVRYDRSGKWYVELPGTSFSQQMTPTQAALYAIESDATIYLDRPGGSMFDRKVKSKSRIAGVRGGETSG